MNAIQGKESATDPVLTLSGMAILQAMDGALTVTASMRSVMKASAASTVNA
jgi:hypothetical protein